MSDLLPYNATSEERALSEATARIDDVSVPIRDTWSADNCPPQMLAWLAWAFSVDEWDATWTNSQRREYIKRSLEVHKYKGTIGAVKDALRALEVDAQVQEWFAQIPAGDPYTFRVALEVDQLGITAASFSSLYEVIMRTKNLRSHLDGIQLSVRSVAGPRLAIVAGVGSEVALPNYQAPLTVLNEDNLVF